MILAVRLCMAGGPFFWLAPYSATVAGPLDKIILSADAARPTADSAIHLPIASLLLKSLISENPE